MLIGCLGFPTTLSVDTTISDVEGRALQSLPITLIVYVLELINYIVSFLGFARRLFR